MQNLYETVKKAQMVVQVEAVRVQKELATYILFIRSIFVWSLLSIFFFFKKKRKRKEKKRLFIFSFAEQSLMVIVKVS
jgi:hypothetical protein